MAGTKHNDTGGRKPCARVQGDCGSGLREVHAAHAEVGQQLRIQVQPRPVGLVERGDVVDYARIADAVGSDLQAQRAPLVRRQGI